MKKKFVHLHVHSEYSLLDGLSRLTPLIRFAKENQMNSISLTDHGTMYGAVEFYKKCKKESIKPIIGMESYITEGNMREKPEKSKFKNYHLLLLAKNNLGYENLMKLTSLAHLEGYYYRPRFDMETLKKYSQGLIVTSSCPLGQVGQSIIEGNYKKAKEVALSFLELFGKDYYLEIQRHEADKFLKNAENEEIKNILIEQKENEKLVNSSVIKLSRELGIPLVATNDVHYIKKEDALAQDALVCISTGKNVKDIKRLRYIDVPSFYLRTIKEMYELFSDYPDACENTYKISEKCNLEITLNKWYFPNFSLELAKNPNDELQIKAEKGLKARFDKLTPEIKERFKYELDIIIKKGYSTYFLIVADIAQWCIEKGIVTNTRGSTAGSLVAYSLGIININPLKYDLPFERFLTPWRPSPPDIDFDIADDRREEVIEYMTEKYGHENVAQICTFGRMLARGSVRDIARVLGYPYATGDKISKLIPIGSQGFPMTIEKALEISIDLKKLYDSDDDAKKIINLAKQVEGNARHISVHAAGVVISPDEITKFTPIQLDPEGKKVITQYDMDSLDPNVSPNEAIGLLKFDLLGLRNLSILGSAIKIVEKIHKVVIDLRKINLEDAKTFEMLSRGDTMGVFQLSGSGMTRYLKDLKPERVDDLMAMVALYRPGPMAQIPEYILRKNNPDKIEYFDERMKEYLGKSYGLLVYQDDVFLTAINIAGYSWEEADKFRKAVGKKIPQEMEKQKDKFIKGSIKNGLSPQRAEELFRLIEPFSGYGFNKAHAASYGMVAYWTAYMKANYPVEFMTALLTAEAKDAEKVSSAVNECRRMGIKVLPPDINESKTGFEIVDEETSMNKRAIRFGFDAIKNVGKAAIEAILEAREKEKFLSFPDFLSKTDARRVNKKVLESLIKVGALSSFGKRASLLSVMDEVRNKIQKPKSDKNQAGLFTSDEMKMTSSSGIAEIDYYLDEFSDEELQSLERQLLGFSLSAKPINEILENIEFLATHKIEDLSTNIFVGSEIKLAVVITDIRVILTKKTGQEMAFVKVRDETGNIETVVFPKIFEKCKNELVDNKPILIKGRVDVRDETPTLIVNEFFSKSEIENNIERLYIRIPKETSRQELNMLKKLFQDNPGDKSVTLVFEGNSKSSVDLSIKINWSENISKNINQILHNQDIN